MPTERQHVGPDWTDIGVMVRALQEASKGTVEVHITFGAAKYSGSCEVLVWHEYPVLTPRTRPTRDEVREEWPSHKNKTVEGTVYRILHQLDAKYQPEYEQSLSDL